MRGKVRDKDLSEALDGFEYDFCLACEQESPFALQEE